ncbi:hypothetical protein ATL51_1152 [Pseudonocardia alni]|uniref:Uncharacterized protein n=1 Tax=Pseudonocardia alni TaxID=33907 RepID=A0AA44ULN9_PSEA5|nr:hypothetical protein ATL51_1152 [Pseudonocardia alni]
MGRVSAPPVPGRALRPVPAPVPAARTVLSPVDPLPVSPGDLERLRENLGRVLAGLRWPAHRWQVLAEAEAWGVSGVVRQQILPLPDGRYPSFEAVVEVLTAAARGRLRPAPVRPAIGADRLHPAERAGVAPRPPRAHGRPAPAPGHRPA